MNVSIIIPTYNGGATLADVLQGISVQDSQPNELIVIDSSSSDSTARIAKEYGVQLVVIPQIEFGHGKTRNAGAKLAKADIVVFLNQDAIPRDTKWLQNLINPLFVDCAIVATFSRQIARDDAPPMEKYFYMKMYTDTSYTLTRDTCPRPGVLFSTASSAIRREFLMSRPFAEDILMSEDQEWAKRVIEQGHSIRYSHDSAVTHSHDTKLEKLFARYFDFGVSHSEINAKGHAQERLIGGFRHVFGEIAYLFEMKQYGWIPRSVVYNGTKFLGLFLGRHHKYLPMALKRRCAGSYGGYWQRRYCSSRRILKP